MSEDLMEKVSAFGEKLRIGGAEVGRKVSAGMSSMSFKMRELFQGQNEADKFVEEATADTLDEPDWATNLELCDMINHDKINSLELIRAIKNRINSLKSPRVQFLALVLLETVVKNCDKAFSEVASERVVDEMVKLIDDPDTLVENRNKALMLIEAWGDSSDDLRYLPVYEETYKSLKARGIRFPGRDSESLAPIFTPPRSVTASEPITIVGQQNNHDVRGEFFSVELIKEAFDVARNSIELLTTVLSSSPPQDALKDDLTIALVDQCHQSKYTVQRIIETSGDDEAVLFEALNINDEIQKVLSKYEDLKKPSAVPREPEPAMIPVAVEPEDSPSVGTEDGLIRKSSSSRAGGVQVGNKDDMMDDFDEMVFGKKTGGTSESRQDTKKQQPPKDDLISF
ncbi:TOM1-like protein 1 [Rhododendron vialii]|uniref:TOM1-like protein 1 n=1 Tax=Rhododendron vialii TaxID=182163 RepID=UPI00265EB406|nr:TOM1-like protein 1 [Rhododendron vialii]